MAPASHTIQLEPVTLAGLLAMLYAALARRINDGRVCFIDWVIGLAFVMVFGAGVFSVGGFSLGDAIDKGALWAAVAALAVTRSNGALVHAVSEFVRGKYGGAHRGENPSH